MSVLPPHIDKFDSENKEILKRIWFCGDVHSNFQWLARTLLKTAAEDLPSWIIFLGDLDLEKPFDEYLAPLHKTLPNIKLGYIFGNHDSDTVEKWEWLHSTKLAINLHGTVSSLKGGIRIAGLGGNFLGRVWYPPDAPRFDSYEAATRQSHLAKQRPTPGLLSAIYTNVFDRLSKQHADILITHEAGSAHPYGFVALDDLARSLGVKRHFHGHHHDNRTEQYRQSTYQRGFDMVGVSLRGISNGLGEVVFEGGK